MSTRLLALLVALALAGTACLPPPPDGPPEDDAAEESPEEEEDEPTQGPEEKPADDDGGGNDAEDEGWDGEATVDDIQAALEDGAFPEIAGVKLVAEDEPGHVRVVTEEDTPFLGDVGAFVGDTCEEVPELKQVTVDHSEHGGEVVGPVEAPC